MVAPAHAHPCPSLHGEGNGARFRDVDKALATGTTKARDPEDHGFIDDHSFNDPDGHVWAVMGVDAGALGRSDKRAQPKILERSLTTHHQVR